MKKTYIILGVAAFLILSITGYFLFRGRETVLAKEIPAEKGDLITKNISKGNFTFVTSDGGQIIINLVGPSNELDKVVFNDIGDGVSELSLPDDSEGISGTISVPGNIRVINLDLPPDTDLINNDRKIGNKSLGSLNDRISLGGDSIPPSGNNSSQDGQNENGNQNNQQENQNQDGQNNNQDNGQNQGEQGNQNGQDNGQNDNNNNQQNNNQNDQNNPPATPPACGNGKVEGFETCDDGNLISGDGCSASCGYEAPNLCGNGFRDIGEQCDDGNKTNNDGCSASCFLDTIIPVCGNGKTEYPEECDDNNTADSDGCSSSCTSEGIKYTECTLQIRQEERNACCTQLNKNTPHEDCEGYWIFDYLSRLCYWHCPPQACNKATTQAKKDSCCAKNNENKPTPACMGDWIYDNSRSTCEFQCAELDYSQYHSPKEINTTTEYCLNTYTDEYEINQCCDEFLKTPLSLGSRPGYPDCLGTWSIKPGTNICQFDCVSDAQAIEILNKLKENAPPEQ